MGWAKIIQNDGTYKLVFFPKFGPVSVNNLLTETALRTVLLGLSDPVDHEELITALIEADLVVPSDGGSENNLSPTLFERGQNMLAKVLAFAGRAYMASAPVMALGAMSAASTLGGAAVGSPTYLVTDETKFARTAPDAPLKANGSWGSLFGYSSTSGAQNTVGGQGPTYSFYAENCTAFDISCYSGGTVTRALRLRVNGEWAQEADYVTTAWGGGRCYIKFTLPASTTGLFELSVETTLTVLGMNIVATSVSAPDTSADIKGEMWWDSYAVGGAAWTNSIWAAPARLLMESFGVTDPVPQGRASQGWVNLIDDRNILQRIGLDAGFAIADPHFSAMCNSVNDRDEDIPTVAANMALGVQALQTAYPDSWIPVIIGLDTAVDGFPAGALDSMWDACSAVADNRTLMIDGRSWPKISMTGTLPNGKAHDSIDGVHPGPNERALLRTLVRAAYIAALQAALA